MDDELLCFFINESREHLATIEADLLTIEEAGADVDTDLVNKVFRAAHSIKGTSSFFGLNNVKDLAHKAETVLDMLRSGTMIPNVEITSLLLAAFDKLREMINNSNESENEDISELVESLTALASSYIPHEKKPYLTGTVSLTAEEGGTPVVLPRIDYELALSTGKTVYSVEYDLIHDIERRGNNVLDVFRLHWTAGEIMDCTLDFDAVGTLDELVGTQLPLRLIFAAPLSTNMELLFPYNRDRVRVLSAPTAVVTEIACPQTPGILPEVVPEFHPKSEPVPAAKPKISMPNVPVTPAQATAAIVVEDSIRVNVGVLERLMNLAGELVLGRNQLRASIAQKNSRALATADQRINQITSELQDVIMQTRLQPIGNVFGKFPRVVRDLAGSWAKRSNLIFEARM
jgi:two-component system chemotaxis sensor kinase CheA